MFDEKLGQNNQLNNEQGLNTLSAPAQRPNTLASYPLDNNPMALPKVTGREVQVADSSGYGSNYGQPTRFQGQYQPAPQYVQQQQSYGAQQGTSPDAFFGSLQDNAAAVRARMSQGAQQYQQSGPATEADLQQGYLDAQAAKQRAQQSRYDANINRDQGRMIQNEQRIIGGNQQLRERDYRFGQRQVTDNFRNQNGQLGVERNRYRYEQQQERDGRRNRRDEANTGYVENTNDLKTLKQNVKYGRGMFQDGVRSIKDIQKLFGGK